MTGRRNPVQRISKRESNLFGNPEFLLTIEVTKSSASSLLFHSLISAVVNCRSRTRIQRYERKDKTELCKEKSRLQRYNSIANSMCSMAVFDLSGVEYRRCD